MTLAFVLRFLIILLAMMLSGIIGYLLARRRTEDRAAMQIAVLSAQIAKMRRRAHGAERDVASAHAQMSRSRRRQRRIG